MLFLVYLSSGPQGYHNAMVVSIPVSTYHTYRVICWRKAKVALRPRGVLKLVCGNWRGGTIWNTSVLLQKIIELSLAANQHLIAVTTLAVNHQNLGELAHPQY